jgi:hypothetical protein
MPNMSVIPLIAALATGAAAQQSDRFTRFAGCELGQATLSDVQQTLGPSQLHEAGDAGDYEAWICYLLPNGQVEFNSGEMGAGTDLLGFTVSLHGRNKTCPRWPQTIPVPELQIGGIRLGISVQDFIAQLKAPIEWRGNIASGNYQFQRDPTQTEILALPQDVRAQARSKPDSVMLDVGITVEGTFENGRLVKLTTWKIESY